MSGDKPSELAELLGNRYSVGLIALLLGGGGGTTLAEMLHGEPVVQSVETCDTRRIERQIDKLRRACDASRMDHHRKGRRSRGDTGH